MSPPPGPPFPPLPGSEVEAVTVRGVGRGGACQPVLSLQASPMCCLCSALPSLSTRCSSCPGATSASRTPAEDSWPCCSRSDTGACPGPSCHPALCLAPLPSPLLPGTPLTEPWPLQLHLRAHPAGAAPGGSQHTYALHHRRQRSLPGGDPGAGEGHAVYAPCSRPCWLACRSLTTPRLWSAAGCDCG